MNKKKIFYFLDYNLSIKGGAQISTQTIIEGIRDFYDITIVMPGKLKSDIKKTKTIHLSGDKNKSLIRNPFSFIKKCFLIYKLIKKNKPDILHAQMPVSGMMIGIMKKLNLIDKNITFIFTDRGFCNDYNIFNKIIFKWIKSEMKLLITTTEENKKYWVDYFNNSNNIITIYNTSNKGFEEVAFQNLRITESKNLVLGFAGRFSETKDWPLAEKIIKNICKINNFDINICLGFGTFEEEINGKKMIERLKKENSKNIINFFYNLNLREMVEFYDNIDIFIMTSKQESFGRTAVEAMSRKCCVLATNVGGLKEVIGNEKFLFKDFDEGMKKIIKITNEYKSLDILKENCYKRYYEKYSVQNNIDKHLEIYNSGDI